MEQMRAANGGNCLSTQLHFAVTHLRDSKSKLLPDDIISFLCIKQEPKSYKCIIEKNLRLHPRVHFGADGYYTYRPLIPGVQDELSLLSNLQGRRNKSAVAVEDLKDGWNDCERDLIMLDKEHKVLITREKGSLKRVYYDEPTLWMRIDDKFKSMWHDVNIPTTNDLPTSIKLAPKKMIATPNRQARKVAKRKIHVTTNKHVAALLKDFSYLRD